MRREQLFHSAVFSMFQVTDYFQLVENLQNLSAFDGFLKDLDELSIVAIVFAAPMKSRF